MNSLPVAVVLSLGGNQVDDSKRIAGLKETPPTALNIAPK